MARPIEGYAVIGDCRTAALVGDDGSIDWLCLPRFDSASVFAALLGDEDAGRWRLAPASAPEGATCTSRRYRPDTFTLETRWATPGGEVVVVDVMPRTPGEERGDLVRRVIGVRGRVRMRQEYRLRFDYGGSLPWVRQIGTAEAPAVLAVAGPDAVVIRGPAVTASGFAHHGEFEVAAGETVDLALTWFPGHREAPDPLDVGAALDSCDASWREWAADCAEAGIHDAHDAAVRRSILVLRALTDEETGGIVAAATTSLPEEFGGPRNWDYRYVWLRDAALTLETLMRHGYAGEAAKWRAWLLRAIAGSPEDVQIMYGVAGERRLPEWMLPLAGYEDSRPVRIGNAASGQFQADVFGEVMLALDAARHIGLADTEFSWSLQRALLDHIGGHLDDPDSGIWEVRGPARRFTHSRAMLWAAFDRGVCAVENDGLDGPVDAWRAARARLADTIERDGFDAGLGSYVQVPGSPEVDAALLQLPQIGYLAPDDPRMLGTVARIEATLLEGSLLRRYRTGEGVVADAAPGIRPGAPADATAGSAVAPGTRPGASADVSGGVDGLPGPENPFLACSFWLVEQYAGSGRLADAHALMTRLLALRNDVGLLSEQYDLARGRQAGNTPQALTHLALVRAADAIAAATRAAR
ncbi:glycoside hydrolase family 15 protein [Agromyces archimandritae]|uniref:Glycoside hydrolase family 15 protein n=1 Tax=Agromyces archimandritae TaxID=2781962 RepID=A0A975IPB7_9MICO|nr:glycoside hydrolase family 15 protein [Agromyces archimandritae]QTX05420.1 glycoside hydrolase family 15 protein [Agromyces archimandritae]